MNDQPTPAHDNLVLGIVAGAIAGAIGIGIWMLFYAVGSKSFGLLTWLSAPTIGLLVGLTIRKVGRSDQTAARIAGVLIVLVSSAIGYVVTDIHLVPWQPPSDLARAIQNLGNDIQTWILIIIGCLIAWSLAAQPPSPPTTSAR